MRQPNREHSEAWQRLELEPAHKIVVIGGGPAAQRCTFELRKAGFNGRIVLVTDEDRPPYDRTLLSKDCLLEFDPSEIISLAEMNKYAELAIELKLATRATALDTEQRNVTLSDGSTLDYDRLVIATGGYPMVPPPMAAEGVLTCRNAEDLAGLRDAFERSRHVAIIGGGFIGGELAASAVGYGAAVTMLEAAEQPLAPVVGSAVGERVAQLHRTHGVDVRCHSKVQSVEREPGGYTVTLTDSPPLHVDSVLVGVGMRANTDWLLNTGVLVEHGVITDSLGRTTAPGVYAAGDCARWHHPGYDELCRIEHWDTAGKHGAAVARASLGIGEPFTPLPFFWSDQYDVKFQWVGRTATGDTVEIDGDSATDFTARYYDDQKRLTAAFLANRPRELPALRRELLQTISKPAEVRA